MGSIAAQIVKQDGIAGLWRGYMQSNNPEITATQMLRKPTAGTVQSTGLFSFVLVLRQIVSVEGWAGLYRGLSLQIMRSAVASAVLLTVKDKLELLSHALPVFN